MQHIPSSRRQFLRASAAAGIGVAMSAYVSGAEPAVSEKALRWGVIGTGNRGTKAHIPAIKSFTDDMELVAVCDVMENHLQDGLKRAGGSAATYTDYQKLLADPRINAVLVATPNMWHKEIVLAALEAGKHVICEKPMAVTMGECNAMKSAAEKRPAQVVLYSMQLRYAAVYRALREQIEKGAIGKPRQLIFIESRGDWNRGDVWQFDDPKQGKVNWRFSHAASGGTLNEKVCHYFDILHWMVGSTPQRISCTGGISVYRDGRDTWDHASTTMEYADGVTAVHTLCMFGPNRLDLQVIGDGGAITVGEKSLTLTVKGKSQELPLPEEIRHGERGPGGGVVRGQETAVVRMYEDFLDCVKNKKKPWMDADKAMASSRTAWLGELSSQKKQEVQWDDLG